MKKTATLLVLTLLLGVGILALVQYSTPLEKYLLGRPSHTGAESAESLSKPSTPSHIAKKTPSQQEEITATQTKQTAPTDSFAIRGVVEGFYGSP